MNIEHATRSAFAQRTGARWRVAALVVLTGVLVACSTGEQTSPTTVLAVPASNIVVLTVPATTTTVAGGAGGGVVTTLAPGPGTTPATLPPTTVAPSTTVPASGRSVTIARGPFNTSPSGASCLNMCKYVDILISGFEKGEKLTITCFANVGSSGPYLKTADSSGSLHSTTACFFGNVSNVYVTVNEVTSNVVTPWKDW